MSYDLWNDEEPIADRFDGVDVPAWISDDISPYDVAAICQGGCASGAYMPAVTYFDARKTMMEHGDDVLDYLADIDAEYTVDTTKGFSQMMCDLLSTAVEFWAFNAQSVIEDHEPEEGDGVAA